MTTERVNQLRISTFSHKLVPSRIRLAQAAFGMQGWNDMKLYMRESQTLGQDAAPLPLSLHAPTTEFLNQVYQRELAAGMDPQDVRTRFSEDYRKALSDANKAIEYLIDLYQMPRSLSGIHQEVGTTSEVLGHNMQKICSSAYATVVQHEMMRAHLLAQIALELNSAKRSDRSQTKVSEFIDWLDTTVFSTTGQPIGTTRPVDLYSLHDPHTLWNGGALKLHEPFTLGESGSSSQKKESLLVRDCVLDGKHFSIYFNQRTKDDAKSLLKAVKKAQERKVDNATDDVLHIDDINDRIGAKLVVVEGNRDEFIQSLERLLMKSFGEIIDDSKTNVGSKGEKLNGKQSIRHTFIRKRIPSHSDFELIVYSAQEYLNSQYDLGTINDGAAHDLYDLYRFREAANLFFPHELYPELDIELHYARALRKCENELRDRNSFFYLR